MFALLGSPSITASEFLTGGDMFAIGAMVAVCAWWSWHARTLPWRVISRVLLGLAIASRPHFFLLLPIFMCCEVDRFGTLLPWRDFPWLLPAIMAIGITAVFFLVDPGGFAPFHALDWARRFQPLVSHPQVLFYALTAVATALACWYAWRGGLVKFACGGGLVLILPSALFVIFESMLQGAPTFDCWAWYGIPGWLLLIVGVVSLAAQPNVTPAVQAPGRTASVGCVPRTKQRVRIAHPTSDTHSV